MTDIMNLLRAYHQGGSVVTLDLIQRVEAEIERLRNLHADSQRRRYGDGDANALWGRIEAYRNNPEARLCENDVRELAEWWSELHEMVAELDEVSNPQA